VTARLLLIACLVLGWSACRREEPLPVRGLPVLGTVPEFRLTAQTGAPFDSSTLQGHVWVADFIYTNCPGPCPLMSRRMKRIAQSTDSAVRFVSFTVDPARDTPAVLTAYGHGYDADPTRWAFLTGDTKTLEMLDRDAFKLGDLNPSFDHSTRFVLVDRKSRIRGYYGMGMENMLERIVSDAKALEKENS
jgi:protein SCO1/2